MMSGWVAIFLMSVLVGVYPITLLKGMSLDADKILGISLIFKHSSTQFIRKLFMDGGF